MPNQMTGAVSKGLFSGEIRDSTANLDASMTSMRQLAGDHPQDDVASEPSDDFDQGPFAENVGTASQRADTETIFHDFDLSVASPIKGPMKETVSYP